MHPLQPSPGTLPREGHLRERHAARCRAAVTRALRKRGYFILTSTSTQSRASALFTSYPLAGLRLSNRIVVSPMCQYSAGQDGAVRPWHAMHYGSCAISGAALVIVEATAVSADGRITPNCLGLYDGAQEAALTKLVADIRTYSTAALGIQLSHAGRKGSIRASWQGGGSLADSEGGWPTVAPSALPLHADWRVPAALDTLGMRRIRDFFVEAAQRADRCGFDLVELHAAHGYLLHSFVSPLSNTRTDAYGGSLDNRMRFPLEVAAAVRDAWPAGKPLGMRINSTDWHPEGLTLDEAVVFGQRLKSIGIDYVTTSAGGAGLERLQMPPLVPGYMVGFAERVRRDTEVAVMAVGLILTPQQADSIVAAGQADLVGLARGVIDNPRWGWHAANALGADARLYPRQYAQARPDRWPGYARIHGDDVAPTPGAGADGTTR